MPEYVKQRCSDENCDGLSKINQRKKKRVLEDNRERSLQMQKASPVNNSELILQGVFGWLGRLFGADEEQSTNDVDFEPEPFATKNIPVSKGKLPEKERGGYYGGEKNIVLSDKLDPVEERFVLLEERTHAVHHAGGAKLDLQNAKDESSAEEVFEDLMMTELIAKYKRVLMTEQYMSENLSVPPQDKMMFRKWQDDREQWADLITQKYHSHYAPRFNGLGPRGGMPKNINKKAALNIGRAFLSMMSRGRRR